MHCEICKKGELVVDPHTDETYCEACGAVAEEGIDIYVPYEEVLSPHHETLNYALINKGLSELVPEGFHLSKDLRAIHANLIMDPVERSFAEAYPMFTVVCGNLHFGAGAKEEMGILYRKCARNGLTRGRERFAMMFALAELTCSDMGITRDIDALAKEFGVNIAISHTYKASVMKMLEKERVPMIIWNHIFMVLQALHADEKAVRNAGTLLQRFLENSNNGIGRRNSKSIAGAIAYKAIDKAGAKAGQKEIARILGISERGIRRGALHK